MNKVENLMSQRVKQKLAQSTSFSVIAIALSACGGSSSTSTSSNSTTSVPVGSKLTVTKSSAGTYSEASSVAGISLKSGASAAFAVADDTVDNSYAITVNATGTDTLEFDFTNGDANDVIVLDAQSKISGFDTLKVVKGTVDITAVGDLGAITKYEVDSGLKLSVAQIKEATSIVSVSGDAKITVEVKTEAEARELNTFVASGGISLQGIDTEKFEVAAASDATETISTDLLTAVTATVTSTVTAAPTTTPAPALFDISNNAGTIQFIGEATGDISVQWAGTPGSSVATFSRGANKSATNVDFSSSKTVSLQSGDVMSDVAADLNNVLFTGAGKVVSTASAGAQALKIQTTGSNSIATGAGNDSVDLGDAANVSNDDEYDLGADTDEIIIMADNDSTGAIFDAAGAVGAEKITVKASTTAATEIAKVKLEYGSAYDQNITIDASAMTNDSADFTLALSNDANTDGDLTVLGSAGVNVITGGDGNDSMNFGDAANVTNDDKVDLNGGTDEIIIMADNDTTGAVFDNEGHLDVEKITILESTTSAAEIAKVKLEYGADYDHDMTIDASAMTNDSADFTLALTSASKTDGDLTVLGSAGDNTIATGDGNDSINLGALANVTADDAVNSGAGTDELKLVADDDSSGGTLDDAGHVGVEKITILASSTATDTAKLTLAYASAVTDALTIDASALTNTSAVFTLAIGTTATNATNAMTVTGGAAADVITTGDANDSIIGGQGNDTLDGDGGTDVVSYADIAASGDQHGIADASLLGVAINLSGSTVTDDTINAAFTATVKTFGDADVATGKAAYLLAAADATGGNLVDSLSNFEAVTGSARADYIALGAGHAGNGGAGDDVIVGSTGTETITGGAGLDKLTGGAAADTFVLDQIAGSASLDTITDFVTGTDKINVNGSLDTGDVTLASSAFTTFSGSGTATDNAIVNLTATAALADAAAVVAKFEASDSDNAKMVLADGKQVILVVQDDDADSGTDYAAQIWNVDNTGDTITATQIALVEIASGDSTAIAVTDFI